MGSEGGLQSEALHITEIPWRIVHLRIPHFPLVVALNDHPEARDHPVALISETEQVARVEAVSRQAAAKGVTVGMTATRARARCLELHCLRWEPARHADAARALTQRLGAASPLVTPTDEPGCFWLDARGMRHLGGEVGLLARIRAIMAEAGFPTVRLGVADTAGAARAMARHPRPPDPPLVPPGDDAAFLGELPLQALDLEANLLKVLHQLGVRTVAGLRALPPGSLEARFGPTGRSAVDRALARDARRPEGAPPGDLPAATWVLELPVDQTEPLLFGLRHLLHSVSGKLIQAGLSATRLVMLFSLDDGGIRREILQPTRPLHHEAGLFELLRDRLERLTFDSPVVELQVQVQDAQPAVPQQVHIDAARFDPVALEGALNRLQGRFGEAVVMVPQARDDHRPEVAGVWVPVTQAPLAPARVGEAPPDEPAAVHRMLPAPEPLDVQVDSDGRPVAARLGGRWQPVQAHGPERLSGHWWENPFAREDWRLAFAGQVLWVSRERDGWWLRGWWD